MKDERQVREHLAILNDEHEFLAGRFLAAKQPWAQGMYLRALLEISGRRAILKWVLEESNE